jgi:CDP-paratose 2-epimerase
MLMAKHLSENYPNYRHLAMDIRDSVAMEGVFSTFSSDGEAGIVAVIHTAAQPSHDWAAKEPLVDWDINASATMRLLELTKLYCPRAAFIFTSTNKVYGDNPNKMPYYEGEKRYNINPQILYYQKYVTHGFDENMSIDQTKHSLFGASKLAADIMVQEYGRYHGMNTVSFRCGCITGPDHAGAPLHGFLSYLALSAKNGIPYVIYGYKGKQVRDNIHANDLASAFYEYFQKPMPGAVYNIGGGMESNVSILEAIDKIEAITGKKVDYSILPQHRSGDHMWYISDNGKFKRDYPRWELTYSIDGILKELLSEK